MLAHGGTLILPAVRPAVLLSWLVLVPLAGGPTSCGAEDKPVGPGSAPVSESRDPAASRADSTSEPQPESTRRNERPLPAFEGVTLDGEVLSISNLIGTRLLLFFFNPEVEDARPVATAVASLARERGEHNFEIVGVAMGSSVAEARTFAEKVGLEFPILDDSQASISRKFGLRVPVALLGADAEGYLTYGIGKFPLDAEHPAEVIESQLRDRLRIPARGELSGALDGRPLAPLFEAERLDGEGHFRLADLSDRAVVLVFFLHTCPHCHDALSFFKEALAQIPEAVRPALIGVSLRDQLTSVRAMLADKDLDFFPVLLDRDQSIQNAYGVFGGVPDILLIDSKRRIVHHVQGWRAERDPALARMYLAQLSGQQVPMLLNPKGYTGNDACSVCHQAQRDTWIFTRHASAFDTLVTHGADRKRECVSCHVVGFDLPGGFTLSDRPQQLEDVGCESCHGRGGPHLSPGLVTNANYESVCLTCHNPTHSLGFKYEEFLRKVSHRSIAALTPSERQKLAANGHPARELLPKNLRFVGSESCRSCHLPEFETWAASPHAHAVDSLAREGKSQNPDCLACHTTAFGRPGGFPKQARPAAHPDLARVGCESCHGPGEDHIQENTPKFGNILSLGDKCDSCVILKICGSCHDDANDPGFRFQVAERIERQQHGTIEAGTGRPKTAAAGLPVPGGSDVGGEESGTGSAPEDRG